MEAASARSPGFGEALYDWLQPFFADRPPSEHRLILAACLLHDMNWRAHPDYRAELCFESVTRANIAGVDHAERVFLGLALLNRYKAAAPAEEVAPLRRAADRRSGRPRRRCSAGPCGSGRCCRARRPACSSTRRSSATGAAGAAAARTGAGVRRRGGRPAAADAAPGAARSCSRRECVTRGLIAESVRNEKAACHGRPLSIFPPQTWASTAGSLRPGSPFAGLLPPARPEHLPSSAAGT